LHERTTPLGPFENKVLTLGAGIRSERPNNLYAAFRGRERAVFDGVGSQFVKSKNERNAAFLWQRAGRAKEIDVAVAIERFERPRRKLRLRVFRRRNERDCEARVNGRCLGRLIGRAVEALSDFNLRQIILHHCCDFLM